MNAIVNGDGAAACAELAPGAQQFYANTLGGPSHTCVAATTRFYPLFRAIAAAPAVAPRIQQFIDAPVHVIVRSISGNTATATAEKGGREQQQFTLLHIEGKWLINIPAALSGLPSQSTNAP